MEFPNHQKGLGVDGWYLWLYIWEGRGRGSIPFVGIFSLTFSFNEGLSLEIFILDS